MSFVRPSALAATLALMALGVATVAGCPPGLDHPERFQTGCPADFSVEGMLRDSCTRSSCHAAGDNPAAGLDLASSGVFERLYGHMSDACGGDLISPDGPAKSLIYQKVDGSSTCGSRMPLGDPALSATELLCLSEWITARSVGATLPSSDGGTGDASSASTTSSSTTSGAGGNGGAGGAGGSGGKGGAPGHGGAGGGS